MMRRLADELLVELATSAAGFGDWSVRHSPGAAPELLRDSEPCAFKASITHSGGWIAAGLAIEADIGVDIQVHKNLRRASEIETFLDLAHSGCGESPFFDTWVLREAIAKATRGSVLQAHPVEAELAAACRRHGHAIRAAGFEAIVQPVAPQVSFAVVIHHHQAVRHCA